MLEDVVMHNQTKNGEHLYENDKDYPSIIVITCMLSIFSVIGTTGNAFVLYVFSRKKDKNTSTIFILALASIDFVTCLLLIPFTIGVEFVYKKINSDAVCKIYQFFITSNVPFSAFIMVAIAFDRYFCICRPWMKCIDIRIAKRIIVSLLMFSLSLGMITSLAYGVYHIKPVKRVFRNDTSEFGRYNLTDLSAIGDISRSQHNISDSQMHRTNQCLNGNDTIDKMCQFRNASENNTALNTIINETDFTFTGFCYPNEVILSREFRKIYQTFYASLFLIAFITVFILYALIYRSILLRRSKKLQSSLNRKYSHGKRSTLLACMFSNSRHLPEAIKMIPCDTKLNNKIRNSPPRLSEISFGQVSTTTFINSSANGYLTDSLSPETTEVRRTLSSHSINTNNRNISTEIIKEESGECGSTMDVPVCTTVDMPMCKIAITPNDLRPPESSLSQKKRPKRNGRSDGLHVSVADDKDKNTNKHVIVSTNENGTKIQQEINFKITTHNICRKDTRKSVREKHRLANIKTAGILFIVTIVFIVAFLPAWLMATKLIPPNMIVFYSYFLYNVANPVIYAFFNQAFQKEMWTVLKCSNDA